MGKGDYCSCECDFVYPQVLTVTKVRPYDTTQHYREKEKGHSSIPI